MTGPVDPMDALTCDEVREMAGSYVLGALDPAEAAAVRAHLASCADAHAEIVELAGVVPALADSVPMVEPPAGLKTRIMAAAAADLAARDAPAPTRTAAPRTAEPTQTAAPRPAESTTFTTAAERATRRSRGPVGGWLLGIAAVLAIVVLGGWDLLLQGQLDTSKSYQRNVAAVLDAASKPGAHAAILTAAGGTGSGLAAISASGTVTLAMQDLAPTTGANVYTAWAIAGDNAPIPLGSFAVGKDGTASFESGGVPSGSGIVLALTLEPGPGAKTPTSPIISKGVAG